MIQRVNKACKYFPCHKKLEDCTFCWCPFYPCLNKSLGSYVYSKNLGKVVWSCQECNWIHKKRVVDEIFEMIGKMRFRVQGTGYRVQQTVGWKYRRVGVILLSHGSKLEAANSRVRLVIKQVKEITRLRYIEPACLQLSSPLLSKSIKKLADKGCERIIIIPFFLLSGSHVKRDIPKLIEKERSKYPDIKFIYTEDLGSDHRISDIVAARIQNACD